MCWRSSWFGHIEIEFASAGGESFGCTDVVEGVHRRLNEPDGLESPGQSFLLQERLPEGAALGTARVPQHGKRSDARRKLLPTGPFISRARRLRSSVPVLLPIDTIRIVEFRIAALWLVLDHNIFFIQNQITEFAFVK